MVIIDHADFSSVVTFADQAKCELGRLNILVQNTGVATWEHEEVEGWERTLHTNNLGPGLFAIRMIPQLFETAHKYELAQRLAIVANDMHYWTTIEKDVIAGPGIIGKLSDKDYCTKEYVLHCSIRVDPCVGYFDSKLLDDLFARSLHLHLHIPSSPAITMNSVNPGFCHSGLRTSIPTDEAKAMRKEEEELCFTTEEGRRQLVYGAVGLLYDEEKHHGKYIQMPEVVEENDFVISEDGRVMQDNVGDLNMRNILLLDSVLFGTISASPAYRDESC